jgi:hypothetical protein
MPCIPSLFENLKIEELVPKPEKSLDPLKIHNQMQQ